MRKAALDAFWDFSVKKEGYLDFMYADIKNYVTTGVGNLIDSRGSSAPWTPALSLPWKHRGSGAKASQDEIIAAWKAVKARTDLNQKGGRAYKGVTNLYLEPEAIKALVYKVLASFETTLKKRFPGFESWPADAQLALISIAWAYGPGFKFPQAFHDAIGGLVPDFDKAAAVAYAKGKLPGNLAKDRNEANLKLFTNAATVLKQHLDPDSLYFPSLIAKDVAMAIAGPLPSLVVAAAQGDTKAKAGLGVWLILGPAVGYGLYKVLS